MNKKVLLLYPYFKTHFITPPLGLGYLASYLKSKTDDLDVRLLDCNLEKYDEGKTLAFIRGYNPEVIGFTVYTSFYNSTAKLIRKIKMTHPGIKIVLGGPHASALPKDVLLDRNIDFVISGEGEETFLELINAIDEPENYPFIKGLAYRDGSEVRMNPARENIRDLDRLPFPAWDFIPPNRYPKMAHGSLVKRYPVAPVISSRGCPFSCTFCGSGCIWRRTWQVRSPKNVVDEIVFLKNNFGINEIHFEDDNFTLKKDRALEICEEIMRRRLNIAWSCPNGVRADTIDKELLALMKKAGCYSLVFGIESGDEAILQRVNKKTTLKVIEEAVRMTKRTGMKATGFFIIGLPGETKESILKTISFAKSLPLDRAQFGLFAPLPGSQDFDCWINEQKPKEIDWDKFNFYNVIFRLKDLSGEEVKSLQGKAFREFYLRPRIIFNIFREMHPAELTPVLRRLKDIFRRR